MILKNFGDNFLFFILATFIDSAVTFSYMDHSYSNFHKEILLSRNVLVDQLFLTSFQQFLS